MRVCSALRVAGLAITLTALAQLAAAPGARAQQGGDNPPEILTSDLALKTVLESDRLEANFVIVDTDKVTRVTIDGKEQTFEPADTVMLTRNFVFRQDVTRVRVSATDEAGHTRTVVYTVFRPGVATETAAPATAAEGRFFGKYDVRVARDSNPSNELSLPVSVGDFEVRGGKDDNFVNVSGYGGYTKGNLTGFAGGTKTEYSDDANNAFEAQVVYAGGILALPRGEAASIELSYLFADVNINNDAYAQLHTVGAGYRTAALGEAGETETTLWGGDLVRKVFASPPGSSQDAQQDKTVLALKWDYRTTDQDKLDSYRRQVTAGTESEGLIVNGQDISYYTYVGGDWDWQNRWDSGLLWDIGTGVAYRSYPNDVATDPNLGLGNKRVDIPIRFSTAAGWQFSPILRVMGTYEYKFDLSNKAPYVRQIVGVSVNGSF